MSDPARQALYKLGMSDAQIDVLIKALDQGALLVTKRSPSVLVPKPVVPPRLYWRISLRGFVSIVDPRDASSEVEALRIAEGSEHPWYFDKGQYEEFPRVVQITHDQYCDWLKGVNK